MYALVLGLRCLLALRIDLRECETFFLGVARRSQPPSSSDSDGNRKRILGSAAGAAGSSDDDARAVEKARAAPMVGGVGGVGESSDLLQGN